MVPALVLSLMMNVGQPLGGGWALYKTQLAGYDAMFGYKYSREVWVITGPAKAAYPNDPIPELEERSVVVGVSYGMSVEKGHACDTHAPVYIEIGQGFFAECSNYGVQEQAEEPK